MRLYVVVWLALIVIVGAEVVVTFAHPPVRTLLGLLLVLAVIEAGLGLMYFMHLKYERPALFWTLIPTLIFVLVLMDHFWPDALSLMHQRLRTP